MDAARAAARTLWSPDCVIWVEALAPAVVDMEAEVEGVEVEVCEPSGRIKAVYRGEEGVVWTVEVAASSMRQVRPTLELDRSNRRLRITSISDFDSDALCYKSALGDVRGSQSRGENPRIRASKFLYIISIPTLHRHTLTVPSRLPASRIPAACGTVLQMALVIAARYSELPPESALGVPRATPAAAPYDPSSLPSGASFTVPCRLLQTSSAAPVPQAPFEATV